MNWGRNDWAPYVPVGQKINQAVRMAAQLAKKQKREPAPVKLQGKNIAKTFWGKAWCDNLTAYQDFSNRLPRGATYVRNGSVVDLFIKPRTIEAIVAGSEPYTVQITITELDSKRWKAIRSDCSESIDSLLDLLSGKLSDGVMKRLTDKQTGLFPLPREIKMSCSCPDYSSCCKHLAAVMYGIGARLDSQPALLFLLRGVDHQELVSQAIAAGNLDRELSAASAGSLGTQDLSELFGIELNSVDVPTARPGKKQKPKAKPAARQKAVGKAVAKPAKAQPPVKPTNASRKTTSKRTVAEQSANIKAAFAKLISANAGPIKTGPIKTVEKKQVSGEIVVKSAVATKRSKVEPVKPEKKSTGTKQSVVVATPVSQKKPATRKTAKAEPVAHSSARLVKRKT